MWSQYDEDLSQNTFFKEIKHHHEDILKKASEENWIICVPRTGSFSTDSFSIPIILDHVLVPQSNDLFVTLNKKEVHLENHHLKLNKTDIFLWDVEVLFEETHYIGETSKYLVWCINTPLFLIQNQKQFADNNNTVLCTIQDCIDFLYSETFGHDLLKGIKSNCNEFWKNCEDSFATESLQGQKDFLGNLYSQCLQLCFKSDIIREKSVRDLSYLENFKLSIECYMQYCLGKKLLYNINSLNHFADCLINKTIRNSEEVTLVDLGILQDFSELLIEAKYELSRLNNFVTVLDKVCCLSRIFNLFNKKLLKGNDKQLYVTSDDFLQLLVYLILKSNIPNWIGNLTYLKEFQFSGLGNSEHSRFLVASLEAAIAFIKSSQFLDIKSQKVYQSDDSIQLSLFNECYSKLKETRDISDLDGILANHKAISQAALCHPLCSCVKCQRIQNCMGVNGPLEVLNSLSQNYIIQATLDKDQNLLEYLLGLGCDINCKDSYSKTALHYAAQCGFQDILFLLISYNAEVNVFDNDKNTPLHLACDKGHDNCVKALIYSSHFVEVNLQNHSGETPLFLATRWGYFDIVKILLENGASVCITNNRNLNVWKLSPNYYITRLFLEFGKHKSNTITEENSHMSVDNKATTLTKKEVIDEDSVDCSLLEECCMNFGVMPKTASDLKKIELLLKVIENNDMPMMCFYLGFQTNCMDYTTVGTYNCHPLCRCDRCFQKDSTEQTATNTTKTKFNINMCNKDGFTPLHVAAKFGRTEILRVLLDSGSMLNVRTYKTFYTPLHLAVIFQRVQTVKELLQCGGCEVDAQDSKGYTPLYYACTENNGNLKILELLLQNGADCRKMDFEEKTVLQICEEKNLFRVCRVLRGSMGYTFHREKSSDKLNNRDFDAIV